MPNESDICYGPIAPGQFFIDRLNIRPIIYKTTGVLIEGVFFCDGWQMIEKGGEWCFGVSFHDRGIQIAASILKQMERVSYVNARHVAEQDLRRSDDEWRKQYAPDREPMKIYRCECGVGDSAPMLTHTMNCFLRGSL